MDAPFVRHAGFDDFDAFAAMAPGASLMATPLRTGLFSSAITELKLGDIVLQVGRATPVMALGGLAPEAAWVVLPLGEAGTLRLEGRPVRPGDVGLYGPGAEHMGAISRDTGWALVAVPAAMVEAQLELTRHSALRRSGTSTTLQVDGRAWKRAAALVQRAAAVAAEEPGVFGVAEARRGLREDLLEALRHLLTPSPGATRPKALPTAPTRRRLLRALEELLRAEPGRAGSIAEVSTALGVPPARLRAAIRASFAVEPERYLRLRRLALARTALRQARAEPIRTSLTQVMAAHGFWDPEAFARGYHDLFGEAPALTGSHQAE